MSYGHSDKIAQNGTASPGFAGRQRKDAQPEAEQAERAETIAEPVPPEWYARPELQSALTGHDIGALYRALNEAGMAQRRIAVLTGTTQSQVADIITGRRTRVMAYDVLVRTAEGLSIPRERMGLSYWGADGTWYGPKGTYPEESTVANASKEVTAEMLRRHMIAWGGIIMTGAPVAQLGELLGELGELPPVPLPSRLSQVHVAQLRDLRQRLAEASMAFGSDPQMSSAAAARAERLLPAPGPDQVKQALLAAVAHLHIHAGHAAFDGARYERTMHHLARALELAQQAEDPYLLALALNWAGLATIEHGHPGDGLKILQSAQIAAWGIPPDHERRAMVEACALMDSATALAMLGDTKEADRYIGKSRALWMPTRADCFGDLDHVPALLELQRGRLDIAEQFAAASIRRWTGISQRAHTKSGIVLATIHVKAGEQRGLQLAHDAITDVTKLTSVRARQRLMSLAAALQARPGSDAQDLARMARQVATE